MDFVALKKDPLWRDLWEDPQVLAKVDQVKNLLLNTQESDPHTLGKLRGQLEAFNWLRNTVEKMAEIQMQEATGTLEAKAESASQFANLRRWKMR